MLAPVAAVGIGRALALLAANAGLLAVTLGRASSCSRASQVRSTWRTPAEWSGLEAAARTFRRRFPHDAWVVAPGGSPVSGRSPRLPHGVDRRGRGASGRRMGRLAQVKGPLELVEYYRRQGARYFADLGCRDDRPGAKGLARRRPPTIQGHCGPSRSHYRRPGRFRDALECQLRLSRSPFLIFSTWKLNAAGSPC